VSGDAGLAVLSVAIAGGGLAAAVPLGGALSSRISRWGRRPTGHRVHDDLTGPEPAIATSALAIRPTAKPAVAKQGVRPDALPRVLLETVRRDLPTDPGHDPLAAITVNGDLSRPSLARLAAEQYHLISSDRRSLLFLASRCTDSAGGSFFTELAESLRLALDLLMILVDRVGLGRAELEAYEPLPGCHAYSAYIAWLAHHGAPADVALALTIDLGPWGVAHTAVAQALREHPGHGFDEQTPAFFDFVTTLAAQVEPEALIVVQRSLEAAVPADQARIGRYARLLAAYRLMFWRTLADLDG
jgi:hypothetical protein